MVFRVSTVGEGLDPPPMCPPVEFVLEFVLSPHPGSSGGRKEGVRRERVPGEEGKVTEIVWMQQLLGIMLSCMYDRMSERVALRTWVGGGCGGG